MTESELKKQFIDNVSFDKEKFNQFLKDCVNKSIYGNGCKYEDIVSYGLNETQQKIDLKALEPCMKSVYNQWYKSMIDYVKMNPSYRLSQILSQILQMDEFSPQTAEKQGYLKTLMDFHEQIRNHKLPREGKEFKVLINQSFFNYEEQNLFATPGFLHMFNNLGNQEDNIELRLYLNIKMQNLPMLSKKIYDKFDQNKFPLYFKISGLNNRNDNVVIYTNYKNAQQAVDLLKEIKKENPELFIGAENINPFLGRIDNFIGFGEEPKQARSSFNLQREQAISYIPQITNKFLMKLANLDETIKINDKQISNRQMLNSSIKKSFIRRIENLIKKYSISRNNEEKEQITELKNLIKKIEGINENQFNVISQNYSNQMLKKGYPLKFEDLPVTINDGNKKYTIKLNYNEIHSMLFSLYPDYKEMIYNYTIKSHNQHYSYSEAHVSEKNPFLTKETQHQLDELENQEEQNL